MPEISRFFGIVMEWAVFHREELMEDWELGNQQALPKPILLLE